jgi:hypothetical protein
MSQPKCAHQELSRVHGQQEIPHTYRMFIQKYRSWKPENIEVIIAGF